MTRTKTAADEPGVVSRGLARDRLGVPAGTVSEPGDRKRCRRCGGWSQTRAARGWLAVSVAVPPELDPRGFKWVGVFCSADCLVAYGPEIQRMERLAGQVFEREPPL